MMPAAYVAVSCRHALLFHHAIIFRVDAAYDTPLDRPYRDRFDYRHTMPLLLR